MAGLFQRVFGSAQRLITRRWEAGRTNRLNKAHWSQANDLTINQDLMTHWRTMAKRCMFEAANNDFVKGVMDTHANDIVGAEGPMLQIQTKDAAFKSLGESAWWDWWILPDINGRMSGMDMLKLWIRSCWTCGDFLFQLVRDGSARGPVQTRIYNIHSRRLGTGYQNAGNPEYLLGVYRTTTGKPLAYDIQDAEEGYAAGSYTTKPASEIVHEFIVEEADQVRGVPWLVPCLPMLADVRDYRTQVLDAARQAADHCIILATDHPDATYIEANESVDIERGTQSTAPPGWKPYQMKPEQPVTNYKEYLHEQMRGLGRIVSMPLMMVMLDSSNHNYSSARFDDQVYRRALNSLRGWIERQVLNRLCRLVLAEAALAGAIPRIPADLELLWVWPPAPHVDKAKEANGTDIELKNLTACYTDVLAEQGKDLETHVAKLKRERDLFAAAGIEIPKDSTAQPLQDTPEDIPAPVAKKIKESKSA